MVMAATAEAEGAQALFSYIADVLGTVKVNRLWKPYLKGEKNYTQFKEEFKSEIDTGFRTKAIETDLPKSQILSYLGKDNTGKSWFISSLLIAEKLIKDIDKIDSNFRYIKRPGWGDVFYASGDKEVMGVLSKLFKVANDFSKKEDGRPFFGDINKWSPADIYFATDKAKKMLKSTLSDPQTKAGNFRFAELNEMIFKLIDKGQLLPLSLKKVERTANIVEVNFNRKKEEKLLADTFVVGPQKFNLMTGKYQINKQKKTFAWVKDYPIGKGAFREIKIDVKSGNKDGFIQIRHTPASKGKPQKGVKVIFGYKGDAALGGQLVGIPLFTKQISLIDKGFAKKLSDTWNQNYKKFEEDANIYIKSIGGRLYKGNKEQRETFNNDMGAISGLTVMNAIRPLISAYFKNPKEKQHKVLRALFAYVTSRSINSSPFVIAK